MCHDETAATRCAARGQKPAHERFCAFAADGEDEPGTMHFGPGQALVRVSMQAETERLSTQTKVFVGVTASLGVVALGFAVLHWQSHDLLRFFCYLAVAVLASGLKVQLPGIDGTMSVNFLFILLGVLELSLSETLRSSAARRRWCKSVWQARNRLDPVKVLFNVFGMMANASALTYVSYHWLADRYGSNKPILLMVAALVFFFANTLPISIVIALTEGKSSRKVWFVEQATSGRSRITW